jgi:hypothetical protein
MYPLIDIITAETETHPLDTTGTGKVTNGSLVVRGWLQKPPRSLWSFERMNSDESSLPLTIFYDGGGYSILTLCQQGILSLGRTIGSSCYPVTLIPQYVC